MDSIAHGGQSVAFAAGNSITPSGVYLVNEFGTVVSIAGQAADSPNPSEITNGDTVAHKVLRKLLR